MGRSDAALGDEAIRLLVASRRAILDSYRLRLRESGSPVADLPKARKLCMRRAEHLLEEISGVGPGRDRVDYRISPKKWDQVIFRAGQVIDPASSVWAAGLFFDIAMNAMAEHVEVGAGWEELARISYALNRKMMQWLSEYIGWHANSLLAKIDSSRADERRRIARELHDRIGYLLSISYRNLEMYEIQLDEQSPTAGICVSRAREAVRGAIDGIRSVTSALHLVEPVTSLRDALQNFVGSVDAPDVQARVTVTGDESWVPPETLDEIFLILREALRNAFTHADRPALISANISIAPHMFWAVVEDDGPGIDPQRRYVSRGIGMHTMRERAAAIGGQLRIVNARGSGTRVILTVPT